MGRRGPAPKPTALRILEGNPSHRPLPKNEPRARVIEPDRPEWLEPDAKAEWERVAPILLGMELLTEADGAVLAGYCQAYATWKHAVEALADGVLTFETAAGYKAQRPEVGIANKSLTMMFRLAAELGMTPSGRSRITVHDREGADDSPFGRPPDFT